MRSTAMPSLNAGHDDRDARLKAGVARRAVHRRQYEATEDVDSDHDRVNAAEGAYSGSSELANDVVDEQGA